MKKIILPAALMLAISAYAEVLTPEQALQRVGASASPLSLNNSTQPRLLRTTKTTDGEPAVYLFGQNQGYIVVSADDIAPALLGYSENGTFTSNDINPQMAWWLDQYASQIEYARQNGIVISTQAATPSRPAIAPQCTTRWNQNAPYSNMTPTIGGEHCVTGCVATAMAQMMKYHNWPVTGTGSHSYTPSKVGSTVSFDFGATTFDWANMLNSYTSSSTTAQQDAVATLMLACGVSVDMDYTTSASGAQTTLVAVALADYFGYDRGVLPMMRDYYGINEWNDLMYNQLVNYGPVQLGGSNDSSGHSFVCDGYSSDNYFHINWGWGGISDGYFLLTALDPDDQGIGGSSAGYNFNQVAICNVKKAAPDNPGVATPYFVADEIVPEGTTVRLGSAVYFTGWLLNYSIEAISGQFGVLLTDADGNTSYAAGVNFKDLPTNYGYQRWGIVMPANLAAGTYSFQPVVLINEEYYPIQVAVGAKYPESVRVSGQTATFQYAADAQIAVTDFSFKAPVYLGKDLFVEATVKNSGDVEYAGAIRLAFENSAGTMVAVGGETYVDLLGNTSESILYTGSTYLITGQSFPAGTYTTYFIDKNNNKISADQTVQVQSAVTTNLSQSNFTLVGGTNKADASKLSFTADITCSTGFYAGPLSVIIFKLSGTTGYYDTEINSGNVFIAAGETQTVTFNGSIPDADPEARYMAMIYRLDTNNYINDRQQIVFTVAESSGIEAVEVESPVMVKFYNLQGIEINPENATPGMYIKVTTDDLGNRKVAKTAIP